MCMRLEAFTVTKCDKTSATIRCWRTAFWRQYTYTHHMSLWWWRLAVSARSNVVICHVLTGRWKLHAFLSSVIDGRCMVSSKRWRPYSMQRSTVRRKEKRCECVFSTIQLPSTTVFPFHIIEVQSLVLGLETRYHNWSFSPNFSQFQANTWLRRFLPHPKST
jgi:hypothetical protein